MPSRFSSPVAGRVTSTWTSALLAAGFSGEKRISAVHAGQVPVNGMGDPDATGETLEPFELLIYRGFSSSTTHSTAFDADRPALPEGSRIESAELLAGPLDPAVQQVLAGPVVATDFLRIESWG